jgi:hypothetical protein
LVIAKPLLNSKFATADGFFTTKPTTTKNEKWKRYGATEDETPKASAWIVVRGSNYVTQWKDPLDLELGQTGKTMHKGR